MVLLLGWKKMSEEEELIPIVCYHDGIKKLFFHWTKTDELFILKDIWQHNRLTMFGTFRYLHITRDDLKLVGQKNMLEGE